MESQAFIFFGFTFVSFFGVVAFIFYSFVASSVSEMKQTPQIHVLIQSSRALGTASLTA